MRILQVHLIIDHWLLSRRSHEKFFRRRSNIVYSVSDVDLSISSTKLRMVKRSSNQLLGNRLTISLIGSGNNKIRRGENLLLLLLHSLEGAAFDSSLGSAVANQMSLGNRTVRLRK